MKHFLSRAVVCGALLFALPAQAKVVTIAGRVVNGTGTSVAGARVELVRPALKQEQTKVLDATRADASGHFAFAPRNLPSDDLILARVNRGGYSYQNVAYVNNAHAKQFNLRANPSKVEVQVFDATDLPVAITALVHHLAIKSDEAGLKCVERYVWSNGSKKTFMGRGPQKITVRLNLPDGAQNVRLDSKIRDAKLFKTAEGWGVAQPLPPGTYDQPKLIVNYTMPWPLALPWSRGINFSKTLIYPTNFFFVARETGDRKLQVSAPDLQPDQEAPVPIGDKQEVRIVNAIGAPMAGAPAVLPGKTLSIFVSRPISPLFYAFCLFVGALVLGVPLTIAGGRRAKNGAARALNNSSKTLEPSSEGGVYAASFAPATGGEPFTPFPDSPYARQLIEEIARLDDEGEAGTLDATAYQTRRAALKTELLDTLERGS